MKFGTDTHKPRTNFEAIADPEDFIEVEIQPDITGEGLVKLYVHVNGETVVRIGRIKNIQLTTDGNHHRVQMGNREEKNEERGAAYDERSMFRKLE